MNNKSSVKPPVWLERFLRFLDSVSIWSGRLFSFLIVPLVLVPVIEVAGRIFFNHPTVWALELTYMLCGTLFMVGAAYALYHKAHIRTDFLYRLWSTRTQGIVDFIFYLLFFLPGLLFFCVVAWDFAYTSWLIKERGMLTSWYPPIYPFKAMMPLAGALLLLQGISEMVKSLYALIHERWL